jgi:putative DNA primase/helicase
VTSQEIHERVSWPDVLRQLGIPETALRNQHGPCPACGGRDRFRFDNREGRGTFFCNGCGAGDGFQLLRRVHGWGFAEACRQVLDVAGLAELPRRAPAPPVRPSIRRAMSGVPARVYELLLEACAPEHCVGVVAYLRSRGLWPLHPEITLRAHVAAPYWSKPDDDGPTRCVGRYESLVAPVRDRQGALVTAHVTYLDGGKKLRSYVPRKLLSGLGDHEGCAAQIMPCEGEELGIAEGIETALSASRLHQMPVWAALNSTLLAKFQPPEGVTRLVIFADRDTAGLEAALALMERLQGQVRVTKAVPPMPYGDWNNVLQGRSRDADEPGTDAEVRPVPAWWRS